MEFETVNDIQSSSNINFVDATETYYKDQLAKNAERIQSLEEHVQRVTQRDYSSASALTKMRDEMHDWTMNALRDREISETNAEEISEICGFELTNEVEVEVSVTYSMTVNVGPDEDVEDIVNNINFDSIDYDTDKISWVNPSIDRIDF